MDRKKFLKNGLLGAVAVVTLPSATSCKKENETIPNAGTCAVSPSETEGPFPIRTPAQLVRENIIGNKTGVPLVIKIKVENVNNNCQPLEGALVDIWHCDARGNYSEYSRQMEGDFTNEHFLRGRQATNANGIATFVSIYPGWYPGRAPHLHLEVKNSKGKSLLITQTAFPEAVSSAVYATGSYRNGNYQTNANDWEFRDSLKQNMATSVIGNITDGYTLIETLKVEG